MNGTQLRLAPPLLRRCGRIPAWALGALALPVALLLARAPARVALHGAVRALQRAELGWSLRTWPHRGVTDFVIYYPPGYGHAARIVAVALDRFYPRVARDFGLPTRGARWPVVVLPPQQMAAAVAGPLQDPPLGAYWRGAIWLLTPSAALGQPATAAAYEQLGPVSHELTHLADDVVSAGATPRWLDEGIAQYEEWRLSGWLWYGPANRFAQPRYSWQQLSRHFSALPNQALAYRQALAATRRICATGPGACVRLLQDLRHGMGIARALRHLAGAALLGQLQRGAAWTPGQGPRPGQWPGPPP